MKSVEKFELLKLAIEQKWDVDVNGGDVYSKSRRFQKKKLPGTEASGYIQIGTTVEVDGIKKRVAFYKHQIVACAAGHNLVGMDVNHINGNKKDNRLENLEVVTHKENMKHCKKHLTMKIDAFALRLGVSTDDLIKTKKEAEIIYCEYLERLKEVSNSRNIPFDVVKKLHKCG